MKKVLAASFILGVVISFSCNNGGEKPVDSYTPPVIPAITFAVATTFIHDTSSFTEGLEFYNGKLIESTGLNGKSKLLRYDLVTGKVEDSIKLDDKYFGEGITIFRDTIYQLTYKEGVVHLYDAKTFKKIKELPYTNGEGWGLTHDSTYLIGTNGGNGLHFYQPGTFTLIKSVSVTANNEPMTNLNEAEFINGYIYVNRYTTQDILKVNPATGEVVAKLDLSSIDTQERMQNPVAAELNGIAYNPLTKKFYVTGKNWSKIYELQLSL